MTEQRIINIGMASTILMLIGAAIWWSANRPRDPDAVTQTGALTRSGPSWTCPEHYVLLSDIRGSDPVCLHGMKATRADD